MVIFMFEMKNVSIKVQDKNIIENLNLTIKKGEIHVLMGPNGAGKSTICKTIMKHPNYEITNGKILLEEQDITNFQTTELAQLGIYYISQNPTAIEGVTNAEMLRLALNAKTGQKMGIFAFNKKCKEIAKKINLPESFLHRAINDGMSGGEKKKNELLHLWMLEPKLILLDEIDSGLDVDALKIVASSILDYYKENQPAILIITHQIKILDTLIPDYVHILKNGQLLKSGPKELAQEIEKNGFSSVFEPMD